MKKSVWFTLIAIGACAALGFLAWPYAFTVVSIKEVEQVKQSEVFDPVTYVDGIWASKIVPTVTEKANDLPTILNEMKVNPDGTAAKDDLMAVVKKYGLITVGEAHVYMVKGSGTVTNVDTSKSLGTIDLQLDNYSGPIKIKLYIGTRIPSDETSVRDAVGFITFGDFKDQTEYGKVAAELNKRVNQEVLAPLNKDQLMGKKVSFFGMFTIRTFNLVTIDLKQINIVPIKIEVQ